MPVTISPEKNYSKISPEELRDPDKFLDWSVRETAKNFAAGRDGIKANFQLLDSLDSRKRVSDVLREADRLVKQLAHNFWHDDQVPYIRVEDRQGNLFSGKATDYLAKGQLAWIADWVDAINSRGGGPVPDIPLLNCAESMAAEYTDNVGQPCWPKVEEILVEEFGLTDARTDPDKPGDWIIKKVTRERNRRERNRSVKVAAKRRKSSSNMRCAGQSRRAAFKEFQSLLKMERRSSKQTDLLAFYRNGQSKAELGEGQSWESLSSSQKQSWARVEERKALIKRW